MSHVMVCDDAADLRLLMEITLATAGHQVTCADGGTEGLALLDELDHIDAIVLDVQMPEVDGWEVLETVRSHPRHADVPVLMCTVKFSHDDLVRAWSLGCDGYINKPFDLNDLSEGVATIVSLTPDERAPLRDVALRALGVSTNA